MSRVLLLADDSISIQRVVELTFEASDLEVHIVGNGDEAMQWVEERVPDVLLADVHMPGASGYEVCQRLKEKETTTPVLLLVGTFERFDEDSAKACAADGHLLKPFEAEELRRRVYELLGEGADTPAHDEAEPAPALSQMPSPDEGPAPEPVAAGVEDDRTPVPAEEQPQPAPEAAPGSGPPSVPPPVRRSDVGEIEDFPIEVAPPPAQVPTPHLSDEDVDRIARRVVELMGDKVLRDIAWEVVPDMAEVVITERLRDLERQVE